MFMNSVAAKKPFFVGPEIAVKTYLIYNALQI